MNTSEAIEILEVFEDPSTEVENGLGKLLNMNPNNLNARIPHTQINAEVTVAAKNGFNVLSKLDKLIGKRVAIDLDKKSPGWEITGFQAHGTLGRGQNQANVKIILLPAKK